MGYVRGAIVAVCIVFALVAGAANAVAEATADRMPSDDAIFQTIKEITSRGPRRPGTPAGQFAVGYVRDQFRAAGLSDVHVEETPTYAWEARANALSVDGKPVSAFPVAYSQSPQQSSVGDFSTPVGGLDAPLVDGGFGTPADLAGKDVKGKIVVFDLKFILPQAGRLPDPEQLQHDRAAAHP